MAVLSTIAYYNTVIITVVKSFIVQAHMKTLRVRNVRIL
jgi:hypothetical protein